MYIVVILISFLFAYLPIHIRIRIYTIRIKMTSSTYASPSPIEKIPAWNIGMDVPLVIEGIVLATIGINK